MKSVKTRDGYHIKHKQEEINLLCEVQTRSPLWKNIFL